jgi:hypothetical protein
VPRFYFHLHNDVDVPDDEGEDLRDLEAAKAYANREVRALAADMAKQEGRIALWHRIDIEDAQHTVVDTVHFRDAVRIET